MVPPEAWRRTEGLQPAVQAGPRDALRPPAQEEEQLSKSHADGTQGRRAKGYPRPGQDTGELFRGGFLGLRPYEREGRETRLQEERLGGHGDQGVGAGGESGADSRPGFLCFYLNNSDKVTNNNGITDGYYNDSRINDNGFNNSSYYQWGIEINVTVFDLLSDNDNGDRMCNAINDDK